MATPTRFRVSDNTTPEVNERIEAAMRRRIEYFSRHPSEIRIRLRELDEEWDIERTLEAGSATISLLGLGLGAIGSKRWLILPLAVQSFFFQHAFQGWCPPLPFLRRLGVRTQDEINAERYALKALRREFESEPDQRGTDEEVFQIVHAVTH